VKFFRLSTQILRLHSLVTPGLFAWKIFKTGKKLRSKTKDAAKDAQIRLSEALPERPFSDTAWRRSARLASVEKQIQAARSLATGSAFEAEMIEMCVQLSQSCQRQKTLFDQVMELKGQNREEAIARLNPAIEEIEHSAASLTALSQKIVNTMAAPEVTTAEDVRRRAEVLTAALGELDDEMPALPLENTEKTGHSLTSGPNRRVLDPPNPQKSFPTENKKTSRRQRRS